MRRTAPAILLAALGACGGAADGPIIVGKISPSSHWQAFASMASASLEVSINGDRREVRVEPDGAFAMSALPAGDLVLRFAMADLDGSVAIHHTTPGERIELALAPGKEGVEVSIVRRQPPMLQGGSDVVPPPDRGEIIIRDHHAVVRLAKGVYPGNLVIHGHHVVVTAPSDGCTPETMPVLEGDLVITGHHVTVAGLAIEGAVDVRGGEHVQIWSTCVDAEGALYTMVGGEG